MKFLDDSAQAWIGPSIVPAGVVHDLVAMVVHLDFALRTNHFVGLSHNSDPCLRRSVQRYLFTTLAQGLRHPDEFFQEFIDTRNVRPVEELAVLGKHFLNS